MRILGIDPGLNATGWGVVSIEGSRLTHVANGCIETTADLPLARRLVLLHDGIARVIAEYAPEEAAVEETFVNRNPLSTLKLGQARGIALLVPALAGLPVAEYAPNHVKKAVVGVGHADKRQILAMVRVLLPAAEIAGADAADALAVAICHAHQRPSATLSAVAPADEAAAGGRR